MDWKFDALNVVGGAALFGVGASVLNAATGALSGFTGATILTSAGYTNYVANQAALMGALGGAVIGAIEGAVFGGASSCSVGPLWAGLFSSNAALGINRPVVALGITALTAASIGNVIIYAPNQILNGMLGYAMYSGGEVAKMTFKKVVASLAVGGAVTSIPLGLTIFGGGYAAMHAYRAKNLRDRAQPESSTSIQTVRI